MSIIRLAGAVLNQTPLDWRGNAANIVAAIRLARAQGVSVLCLPELCVSGYGCEDAFHAPGTAAMADRVLGEILPETASMVVSLGLPIVYRGSLFNAACLAVDGRIAGVVAKRHLAGEGLHYEPRWFKPWPEGVRDEVEIAGAMAPIGDLCFRVGGVGIGFEICEDAWVATRPGAALARLGVGIILNPSASHFAFGKPAVRERFVLEGSRAFGVSYVYSNLVGNEAGRAIYDGGVLIASCGELVARGPRLGFVSAGVTWADVDLDAARAARLRNSSFDPAVGPDRRVVEVPWTWADVAPAPAPGTATPAQAWESGPAVKEEEFTRALALALFDYLRKARGRGYVVSISGGADSAACAVLVGVMAELAARQLGPAGLAAALGLDPAITRPVKALLTTVYQATSNSSGTTRAAARAVAEAVGADHVEIDAAAVVDHYTRAAEAVIGRRLDWTRDDAALQNIQARARGPAAWLLANLRGQILITTSNRSEAAVGYATMDGDTCGGLAPLAGIDKAFLRRWLVWMESTGPDGLGPIPALAAVNRLEPTAELRPPDRNQTDEADLMPYDVLEAVEDAAIGLKMMPVDAWRSLRRRFPRHDGPTLAAWVERFYRLWCASQWKRERIAPSFHLDDRSLDPKAWCRFPILSGGFERELDELRAAAR